MISVSWRQDFIKGSQGSASVCEYILSTDLYLLSCSDINMRQLTLTLSVGYLLKYSKPIIEEETAGRLSLKVIGNTSWLSWNSASAKKMVPGLLNSHEGNPVFQCLCHVAKILPHWPQSHVGIVYKMIGCEKHVQGERSLLPGDKSAEHIRSHLDNSHPLIFAVLLKDPSPANSIKSCWTMHTP